MSRLTDYYNYIMSKNAPITKISLPAIDRDERSVKVRVLNENAIYEANLAGRTIQVIYRVDFLSYGTPLSHWPIDAAGLGALISDYLERGQRPH